ncbi:amino acid ABC transporter ATP-binding protein [Jeotgalibaca sp. A127]|uniref:amino acid ABC transporter ATP-binding protein n=1 Tax=Jeotgalibaca sp. A127 TaxID=3457324 RepID=UPI003FD61356
MIKIENLTKTFGNNAVLDGIDLDIKQGEVLAIIGPSGTGKSTLLRCINQLEVPDSLNITLDGKTINQTSAKKEDILYLRRNTGMVFQQFNLFNKKTALENVMEGLVTVKKIPKTEAQDLAEEELKRVGMFEWKNHYPKHLSGGQQQRVAIARALAMKPKLLLFDEPTSALDPELVGEVLETIKKVANEGYTMIIVSHEMQFVKQVADRVIFINKGKIIEDGPPQQLFEQPKEARTKEFLSKLHF